MRILLFGGTFDPPHNGHLLLLENAIRAVDPDLVFVIPDGTPPHKMAFGTKGSVRYSMCRVFLAVDPRVKRCRFELDRPGKSYTYNTVEYMKKRFPGCRIFLAVGSDMLLSFDTWYESRKLLESVTLVAQSRDRAENEKLEKAITAMRAKGASVLKISCKVLQISSSEIRQKAREGKDISRLVPPAVLKIIRAQKLYQEESLRP